MNDIKYEYLVPIMKKNYSGNEIYKLAGFKPNYYYTFERIEVKL